MCFVSQSWALSAFLLEEARTTTSNPEHGTVQVQQATFYDTTNSCSEEASKSRFPSTCQHSRAGLGNGYPHIQQHSSFSAATSRYRLPAVLVPVNKSRFVNTHGTDSQIRHFFVTSSSLTTVVFPVNNSSLSILTGRFGLRLPSYSKTLLDTSHITSTRSITGLQLSSYVSLLHMISPFAVSFSPFAA